MKQHPLTTIALLSSTLVFGCADHEVVDGSGIEKIENQKLEVVTQSPTVRNITDQSDFRLFETSQGGDREIGRFTRFSGQLMAIGNEVVSNRNNRIIIQTRFLEKVSSEGNSDPVPPPKTFDVDHYPHFSVSFSNVAPVKKDEAIFSGSLTLMNIQKPFSISGTIRSTNEKMVMEGALPLPLPQDADNLKSADNKGFTLKFKFEAISETTGPRSIPVPSLMSEKLKADPNAEAAKARVLAKYDADKSGDLSEEEKTNMREAFLSRFDSNSDGEVDAQEREALSGLKRTPVMMDSSNVKKSAIALISQLDFDKNGTISSSEAGDRWRFLAQADKNGDGQLSEEELVSGPLRFSQPR